MLTLQKFRSRMGARYSSWIRYHCHIRASVSWVWWGCDCDVFQHVYRRNQPGTSQTCYEWRNRGLYVYWTIYDIFNRNLAFISVDGSCSVGRCCSVCLFGVVYSSLTSLVYSSRLWSKTVETLLYFHGEGFDADTEMERIKTVNTTNQFSWKDSFYALKDSQVRNPILLISTLSVFKELGGHVAMISFSARIRESTRSRSKCRFPILSIILNHWCYFVSFYPRSLQTQMVTYFCIFPTSNISFFHVTILSCV